MAKQYNWTVWRGAALLDDAARLVRGAAALGLPIVWTEQNPAGLGPTVPELAALLPGERHDPFTLPRA